MGGNVLGFSDRRFFGFDEQTGQLRGGEHLLRALLQQKGDELLRDLAGNDPGRLQDLADTFGRTGGLSPVALASLLRNGGIPQALGVPRPNMQNCRVEQMYAQGQGYDFTGENNALGRFLHDNPFQRQSLEMALGGRILPSGTGDGRLRVVPFGAGAFPGGGPENAAAFAAQTMLSDMTRSASARGMDPYTTGVFQGMVLGALANMARLQQQAANEQVGYGDPGNGSNPEGFSSLRNRGTNPFVDWSDDSPNMKRRRAMLGMGGAQGGGGGPQAFSGGDIGGGDDRSLGGDMGSSMSRCSSGNPMGIGGGGDDIGAVLNDGGLTVEDKITLMIMMIMKKMDQDIEKQANYINSLQQQQQAGGGKGGGKGGGGSGAPSIDVETMKLKRLIDKRSQMFDMLRQIIDKYNQTAKGIIDSMGR